MTRYVGSVDTVKADGTISGWSIDKDSPESSSELVALVDGEPVVHFACREPRPDVKAAGFPTQYAGFKFKVPLRFVDGMEHALSFQPSAGGDIFSLGGKQTILLEAAPAGEVVLNPAEKLLTGWVSEPENRKRAVLLEVLVDNKLLKVVSKNFDAKTTMNRKINFKVLLLTSRFTIAGPLCAALALVGKESFVCRIESFSKFPRHRKSAKRVCLESFPRPGNECCAKDGRLSERLERKPKPSELSKESLTSKREQALRRRLSRAVCKPPYAA